MDPFTHGLTGLAIGLAGGIAYRRRGVKVWPLALATSVAAVLPDVDAVTMFIDRDLYWHTHRLYTHNLIAAPLIALIASGGVWLKYRAHFWILYLLCLLTVASHLTEDALCSWQLLLLWPFSNRNLALQVFDYTSLWVNAAMGIICLAEIIYLRQVEGWWKKKGSGDSSQGSGS